MDWKEIEYKQIDIIYILILFVCTLTSFATNVLQHTRKANIVFTYAIFYIRWQIASALIKMYIVPDAYLPNSILPQSTQLAKKQ